MKNADWPEILKWIEPQALESLKSRFQTAEILAREAQTTLTVLLAAIGGSAAYAAKILEDDPASSIEKAAAATCIYMIILALVLVYKCMMFRSYPAAYQDPINLMQPNHTLHQLREAELKNIHDRITEAASINASRANSLNRIRFATALSPLIFAAIGLALPSESSPQQVDQIACQLTFSPSATASVRLICTLPD